MAGKDRVELLLVPLENYNPAVPILGQLRAVHISVTEKFFRNLERRKNGNGNGNGFPHKVVLMHPELLAQANQSPEEDFGSILRQEQTIVHDNTAFNGNFKILGISDAERLAAFSSEGLIPAHEIISGFNPKELAANECCVLHLDSSESDPLFELAVFKPQANIFLRVPKPFRVDGKISPFTTELAFAHFLLHDSSVGAVTLTGPAGTGKSTMAIHAAVSQLLDGKFTSIEIVKSTHQCGGQPSFAAFPGNKEQKFAEHRKTVETTLLRVLNDLSIKVRAQQIGKSVSVGGKKGGGKDSSESSYGGLPIHIIPPNFLRGEEFPRRCVIIEEAQNFEPDNLLLAGTRIGAGSRLFVIGDEKQVDIPGRNEKRSGLTDMIHRLSGRELFGRVKLTKCLRGGVAQMFVEAYYND